MGMMGRVSATPQWASSTVTLGYTSCLRTSLTLAQPVIGNWTHGNIRDTTGRRPLPFWVNGGSVDLDLIWG